MPLLCASDSFTTQVRIAVAPDALLALLDDPRTLMRLNPLVVEVAATGRPGEYAITDALRLLGIPLRVRYRVRWRREGDRIETEVESTLWTRLRNSLHVSADGDGARVVETVRATAPRPLLGYVCRTARAAHADMLEGLKARAEAGA